MNRTILTIGVAVASLVVGLAINTLTAQPKEPPAPARVAVVDVALIFRHYKKAQEFATKQQAEVDRIKREDETRKKAIDNINLRLTSELQAGTADYDKQVEELNKLTVERQVWLNVQSESQNRTNLRLSKEMHEEIVKMATTVATERGFTMVLAKDVGDLSTRNVDEFLDQLTRRKVLYADRSLDITDDVLLRLDEAYKAAKK